MTKTPKGTPMLTVSSWSDHFPGLAGMPTDVRKALNSKAKILHLDEGTVVFGPGHAARNLLLLISGTVRVQQLSEAGREIVLYRVHAGESCVLTTACLLAHEAYSAEGIAETDVVAVAIPREVFDDLMAMSASFRAFVFQAYSNRITDLFLVIEEIAFKRLDIRLAQKLQELQDKSGKLHMTHQQLATELGTAREVISRQLQEFQRRKWVSLARGQIAIEDPHALGRLAKTM